MGKMTKSEIVEKTIEVLGLFGFLSDEYYDRVGMAFMVELAKRLDEGDDNERHN